MMNKMRKTNFTTLRRIKILNKILNKMIQEVPNRLVRNELRLLINTILFMPYIIYYGNN